LATFVPGTQRGLAVRTGMREPPRKKRETRKRKKRLEIRPGWTPQKKENPSGGGGKLSKKENVAQPRSKEREPCGARSRLEKKDYMRGKGGGGDQGAAGTHRKGGLQRETR